MGLSRGGKLETMRELFASKFSLAIDRVAQKHTFDELNGDRQLFIDEVLAEVGDDLRGYRLFEVVVEELRRIAAPL